MFVTVRCHVSLHCTERKPLKRGCHDANSRCCLKQRDTGGKAVHEVLLADGAQFPLGKEPGQWDLAEGPFNRCRVMVRLAEETGAAAVASEQQAAKRRRLLFLGGREELLELGV